MALVITIIVLLILAGVTISLVLGDKGILTNAKEAKIETRGASVEEQANLWKLGNQMAKLQGGTGESRESILERVISKRNVSAWSNIPWSNSTTMNIDTGGCVEKARNMYTDKNKYGVTSTLCYGVQWDAALNFIDSNYITNEVGGKPNCAVDSYVRNSTGKGNYLPNLLANTGSNDNYRMKNIYDMAGNVWEWTMETYITNNRLIRGGSYKNTRSEVPSSYRDDYSPMDTYDTLGYRPTLYL